MLWWYYGSCWTHYWRKYEDGYEDAPKGHKHKVGDEVQVHFGAGLDGGKSGKISSLYKNHTGSTWAKGSGNDGEFDVPTSYLRTKKRISEALQEICEMKKAREEYTRKGYFDNETDKKHIEKVYNAGFTLKDNNRGGKNVIEWERR